MNKVVVTIASEEKHITENGDFVINAVCNRVDGGLNVKVSMVGDYTNSQVAHTLSNLVLSIAERNPAEGADHVMNELLMLNDISNNITNRLNELDPAGLIRKLVEETRKQEENDNE